MRAVATAKTTYRSMICRDNTPEEKRINRRLLITAYGFEEGGERMVKSGYLEIRWCGSISPAQGLD
jgi:hypothetical protein